MTLDTTTGETTMQDFATTAEGRQNQMWVLEDINYRRGDVDLDGTITIRDATAIQKYIGGKETFNNIQEYLADYDFDRQITIEDATAIQKYLA